VRAEYRNFRLSIYPGDLNLWISRRVYLLFLFCVSLSVFCLLFTALSYAQDNTLAFIGEKQREIKDRENALRKEEERLKILRKDMDERLEKYTNLLNQLENVLNKLESLQDEKFDRVVKAYESMPPEDAATRLSALPEQTAVKIIKKMKPKKIGVIMANMDPQKVASLTEGITKFEKIFPTR
jgi:flagellar motility protein MotE (MotC chaperone)